VLGAFSLLAIMTAWPLFVEARAAAWTHRVARELRPVAVPEPTNISHSIEGALEAPSDHEVNADR
jgi:hypothetical protein